MEAVQVTLPLSMFNAPYFHQIFAEQAISDVRKSNVKGQRQVPFLLQDTDVSCDVNLLEITFLILEI